MTTEDLIANVRALMEGDNWDSAKGLFDKNFNLDNMKVEYMLSSLAVAGPYKGNETFTFENTTHEAVEQKKALIEWLTGDPNDNTKKGYKFDLMAEENDGDGHKDFNFMLFSFDTFEQEIITYLGKDAGLLFVAFIFVYLYFCYNLGSKLVSLIAVSIIFLSFPVTSIVVQWIFRCTYFGILNIMGIFLVIGIAADDIFVFMDAWRQSQHVGPEVMKKDGEG